MNRTLYFSKVSLNSQEVYNVVSDYDLRYIITRDILEILKNDSKYIDTYTYIDEDGEEHLEAIEYVLSIKDKDDTSIHGALDRTTKVFIKQREMKLVS